MNFGLLGTASPINVVVCVAPTVLSATVTPPPPEIVVVTLASVFSKTVCPTSTFTVSTSRTPTGSFTTGTPAAAYTTFAPQGIVVEWDATNKILFYVQNVYDNQGTDAIWKQTIPFSGNSTITGATSNATGVPHVASSSTVNNTVFVAGYANPELQPDSGDVIYIENRKPISRASDQTEDVKLVVEF